MVGTGYPDAMQGKTALEPTVTSFDSGCAEIWGKATKCIGFRIQLAIFMLSHNTNKNQWQKKHNKHPGCNNVLTLDIKDHLVILRTNIISGCAAVLSWIWFDYMINPQEVPPYFHMIGKRASHFTPAHRGLRITDRVALKLHWVAHHHRLYWCAHVDHYFG